MTGTTDTAHLDGNAAAGRLRDVFVDDVTAATGQCAHCGQIAHLAETHLYGPEPGMVLRCSNCSGVLLRMVTGPEQIWLDMRGLAYLRIPSTA